MGRPAHAGAVAVPVQQVEGGRLLAQQVIVDDIGPDQVVGAQQVEHVGHLAAVEISRSIICCSMKSILSSPMKMLVSPTFEKSCIDTMKVAELNRLSPCVAARRA